MWKMQANNERNSSTEDLGVVLSDIKMTTKSGQVTYKAAEQRMPKRIFGRTRWKKPTRRLMAGQLRGDHRRFDVREWR